MKAKKSNPGSSNSHKKAVVYCRVSSKSQEDGTSLENQEELGREYCAKHQMEVVAVCRDIYPGDELDRPGLDEARDLIDSGKVQYLVCDVVDRLSRSVDQRAVLKYLLSKSGAKVLYVRSKIDDSPIGKIIESVLSSHAELELADIRRRTTGGRKKKLAQGNIHLCGHELYGYRRKVIGEKSVRAEYPAEAEIVRQIFEMAGREHVGLKTIAKRLTERKVPTPTQSKGKGNGRSSGFWNLATVNDIIKNPAYKGQTISWIVRRKNQKKKEENGLPIDEPIQMPDDVTPAIVDSKLWDAGNNWISRNRGESTRNEKRFYLLRGLVYCGKCGRKYYSNIQHGKRGYRCSSYITFNSCGNPVHYADQLEAQVWQIVESILEHPYVIEEKIEAMRIKADDSRLKKELKKIEDDLLKNESKRQKFLKAIGNSDSDDDIDGFRSQLSVLKSERTVLIQARERVEKALNDESSAMEGLKAVYEAAKHHKKNLSDEEKRRRMIDMGVRIELLDRPNFRFSLLIDSVEGLFETGDNGSTIITPERLMLLEDVLSRSNQLDLRNQNPHYRPSVR